MYNETHFNCAFLWDGPGDSEPIKACNCCNALYCDDLEDGRDDVDYSLEDGFSTGSLIVNPGCTYYGFADYDFEGDVYEYGPGELERYMLICWLPYAYGLRRGVG